MHTHTYIYLLVCSCAYTCTDQDIRAKAQDFRAKDPSVPKPQVLTPNMFFVARTRSIDLRSRTCRRTTYLSSVRRSDVHGCSVPM